MKRLVVLASSLSLSLVLAACAGGPGAVAPGTTRATGAQQTKPEDLPKVDPTLVAGIQSVTTEDLQRRLFTSRVSIPGAVALDDAIATTVKVTVDWYADKGPDAPPESSTATPELNVNTSIVGASPQMLGVRVITSRPTTSGKANEYSYTTRWYSPATKEIVEPTALFPGEKEWSDFHARVRTELTKLSVVDQQGLKDKTGNPVLNSVTFNAAGDLVAEIDEGTVAPLEAGTITVTIPVDTPESTLSAEGRAARESVLKPQKVDLGGAAAVEPIPSSPPLPAPGSDPPTATDAPGPTDVATSDGPQTTPTSSALPPETTPAPPPAAPASSVNCAKVKCVALTFDDGPGPYTSKLVDILSSKGAVATFYVVGTSVKRNPAVVRKAAEAGNQIGNHTNTHRQLTSLSAAGVRSEIAVTAAAIQDATGAAFRTVRPPYGDRNGTVDSAVGAPIILWDVDTQDWRTRNATSIFAEVRRSTRSGSIVLMHDVHAATVAAVPSIIDWLKAKGYRLVTVDQLLASSNPRNGQVIRNGPRA